MNRQLNSMARVIVIQNRHRRERGSVLIFSLIILMIMTVLAISGVGNSVLEQRMAGNYYHSVSALQSAEECLRIAEEWLFDNVDSQADVDNWFRTVDGVSGFYTTRDADPDNAMICRNDIDCLFDPTNDDHWCDGSSASCPLPKGFVSLDLNQIQSQALSEVQMPVARQPQFVVEYIGPADVPRQIQLGAPPQVAPRQAFRITAIGWGQTNTARHVLQSHVLIPL